MALWRDNSGRLTFDLPGVASADYPALCREIADALGLVPIGDIAIGPDQMFWTFRRGDEEIGLDWDVWMQFMVVAKSDASERLLRDVAGWLDRRSHRRMPQITDQDRLLRENSLVFVSNGPLDGMWRCQYLKCPNCGYYVLKGEGYDECPCGNISIDSDMLRVAVRDSAESAVECYNAVRRGENR